MRVVGVALLALLAAGTAASAREVESLPRSGLAVETPRGVALVGLDGRVRRTLPGFRLRFTAVERSGQVELRDASGKHYELRHGAVTSVARGTVTLVGGFQVRFFKGVSTLRRDGRVVRRFAPFTHVEVDDTGTVLTTFRVSHDGKALTAPVARNLLSRAQRVLPKGCRVGAARANARFELCGYPFMKTRVASIVRVDASGRRVLAGSDVYRGPQSPSGWWRSVALSPRGERLLAQWSGECEIPQAHVFDAHRGAFRTSVLATTRDGAAAEAETLGWAGRAALVFLPQAACGPQGGPGVYAYSPSGRARLVYPLRARLGSVAFWR